MGGYKKKLSCMLIVMKKQIISNPCMLILYGPTGTGKTDMALKIAEHVPAEIINMDMGQFYTSVSIGTAKPDWKNSITPHHLFDIIDQPVNYTVSEYRMLLYKTVRDIIQRNKIPIIVGGSSFYLYSLFFPPQEVIQCGDISHLYSKNTTMWDELYMIDPHRALSIAKTDIYRINRALAIWHATKKLPSSYAPTYKPEMNFFLLFVTRDRQDLISRIENRVVEMIQHGWIDEAKALIDTPWKNFLQQKNMIGYNEIFNYLSHEKSIISHSLLINQINIKTRQYAKRQCTFWGKLEREIKRETKYTNSNIDCIETVNLTNVDMDLYINELLQRFSLDRNHE
ncbi:MAG TPA: tRNA (adenosine(37)-N6)-dimethylallyltransferase MiaA [Candidatus Babeliales bacterium]|nr:tRNA (adenosine(37)-N6)-dimethylallyltransferase MiaA [Candidatus Babeliales bacterium]